MIRAVAPDKGSSEISSFNDMNSVAVSKLAACTVPTGDNIQKTAIHMTSDFRFKEATLTLIEYALHGP